MKYLARIQHVTAFWVPPHRHPDFCLEIIKFLLILSRDSGDLCSCLQRKSCVESVLCRMEHPDGLGGRIGNMVTQCVCNSYPSERHVFYF